MRRFLPYALFLVLVAIFLWRPIFKGEALLPGDYLAEMAPWNTVIRVANPPQWNPLVWDAMAQFYPWRVFYARSMSAGHIPLWNPYQFCGTPFLANGQSAVLYPLNLIFLIFDPITAFTVFAALHLFMAMAFMYLLLGELGCKELGGIVGGICFAFSAFMVLWLELPTFVSAAVWLPLMLLLIHRAVERRSAFYGMLAGAALALAFLAGHFQIAFYVAFAAMLWWLWKLIEVWRQDGKIYAFLKVVVPFAIFAVIAFLIAAPQVLPTQELAANSHRACEATPEGYARFVGNAVKPYRLITAFVPDFYGNPSKNNYFLGSAADYMEYGMYIGILPLMLALIALFRLRNQRYVGFFALLALIALLAATGTPINLFFYYLLPGFSALGGPNRILLLYFFGIAALAAFGTEGLGKFMVFSVLAVTVIVADLFAFGINFNPTCERSKVYPKTELTTTLKRIAGNSRIAPINSTWSLFETPNAILPPNSAMVYGLYDMQGYDSLFLKSYQSELARIEGVDPSPPENGNMVLVRTYTSDLAQVAQYVVSHEATCAQNLKSVACINGLYVYRTSLNNRKTVNPTFYSFRLGLFLMLIGIGALTSAGTYRVLRGCQRSRR